MDPHRLGLAFGAKRATRVFKISDILFLFGVHRYGGLAVRLKLLAGQKEFMGDVRFRQFAKCMIQGGF